MTLTFQVLGAAGRDNAAYVRLDSGQQVTRLLFDCGEATAATLGLGELHLVDALLFSHLHIDHVAGFDNFFRTVYGRTSKPNQIYGPPRTSAILQHRMQGFLWNLESGAAGAWDVFDIAPTQITGSRLRLGEAFAHAHPLPLRLREGAAILITPDWALEAYQLDHMTPSLAYLLRESPRVNIASERLAARGLQPGAWLQQLKSADSDDMVIVIDGAAHTLGALRAALLTVTPGASFAYCTDFRLDDAAYALLVPALTGCDTLLCECQYRAADAELAERYHHMSAPQVAELARRAGVGQLILFHVSDRYRPPELAQLLAEARAIFPNTHFPAHWGIA